MSKYTFGFVINDIIKSNRTSVHNIISIKSWLTTQSLPQLTDEQIVVFLLSCDNNQELTKSTLLSNYKLKCLYPYLFTNRYIQEENISKILNVVESCEIPNRYNGCTIVIGRFRDTNYQNFDFTAYVKLLTMLLDAVAYESNPSEGLIMIVDGRGSTFGHITRVKLSLAKFFLEYIQEAIPVKLKSVHVVYSSYAMELGFKIIKPFVKADIVQNVHLHSLANMELFYENHIPKKWLPKDYGGELESMSFYIHTGLQRLAKMDAYFEFEEQQRLSVKDS